MDLRRLAPTLARTGSDLAPPLRLAVLILLLGAVLVLLATRRRAPADRAQR